MIINLKKVGMVGDKPIEKEFFSVLYDITSCKPINPFLAYFALLAYLFQIILCYFAITDPSDSLLMAITSSSILALVIAALSGTVLVELLVAFVYKWQLQLMLQLMVYRYILFPMVLIIIVAEIEDPIYTSTLIASILLVVVACLAYFANFIIHCYCEANIARTFQSVSGNFVITDCLLILTQLPTSFLYIEGTVVILLLLHLLTRHQLARYRFSTVRQQLEYYSMLLKDFLIVIYLSKKALLIGGNAIVMLIIVSPLLIFGIVHEATRKRRVILRQQVFTAEAPMSDFLELIEAMGVELGRFKSNQDLQLQGSLLLVFMALHKRRCGNSACLLLQRSTEEEIRNCNSSNNMKILKHKIVKKIEYLFELYERSHSDHAQLKLYLIAFYINHLPNRLKIAHLVSTLRTLRLSWQQRLVFFGLLRRVEQIEVVEGLMEASKSEDEFLEFKKQMSNAVSCFQEFWEELMEERVDVNQLTAISSRLFPLKKTIEHAWRKHINQEKFSSWNILRTYTFYRRNILHDYTNSVILEDYCKIVEQRLKNKHEMSYSIFCLYQVNSETEQAVMAISLTESSLGNIASMNNQSCKLFNFPSKAEMLQLRVNDIMPSVYSIVHDNILSSFLKNRFKSINQDLRFVFGKNKNGFIFPFMLQLRKLSWNLNDELIFIAHLEPARLRNAPIYCIADLEGDLQDYTSTFAWLFMKKGKDNAEIKRKNIQEMIPSFFETIDSGAAQGKVHFHERTYSHKNGQNIEVQFTASELYIKAEKVGYLVEGSNTQAMATFKEGSISATLDNFYKENNIYVNSYNPKTLSYQIPNEKQMADKMTKEFTIPFLKTSDIEGILNLKQTKPTYDRGIKTLRLMHGCLEHIMEEESFHSDQDSFEMKEISIIKKIQKMKEELNVMQKSNIGDYFKKTIVTITLLFILLLVFIISKNNSFQDIETLQYEDKLYKLQIRELLPQYLIYTLRQMPLRYTIRDELKNNVMKSSIDQHQKEDILRAVFESPITNVLHLNQSLLTFDYSEIRAYDSILTLWYLTAVAAFLYLVTLFIIYALFKFKISKIYLIFLSISENKLQEMQEDAKQLVEYLSAQNIEYFKIAPLHGFKREETEEAEFSRLKKMKNDYTMEDLASLTQLTLPVLLILFYSIFCCVFLEANFSNYQGYMNAWLDCSELMPSTSVSLFNTLSNNRLLNASFPSSFGKMEEQFEYVVILKGIDSGHLLELMQGDPCSNYDVYEHLAINLTHICSNTTTFLQYSLMNVLNYMSTIIHTSNTTTPLNWEQLIQLEYHFVKPVLTYISASLGNSLDLMRHSCESNVLVLGIVFISLLLMAAAYIICYPLFDIYEKFLFTSDLIKILPSERQSEPQQALAAMTTEAMETY